MITNLVYSNFRRYSASLRKGCTHLVAPKRPQSLSQKLGVALLHADAWQLRVVNEGWVQACLAGNYRADEALFQVAPAVEQVILLSNISFCCTSLQMSSFSPSPSCSYLAHGSLQGTPPSHACNPVFQVVTPLPAAFASTIPSRTTSTVSSTRNLTQGTISASQPSVLSPQVQAFTNTQASEPSPSKSASSSTLNTPALFQPPWYVHFSQIPADNIVGPPAAATTSTNTPSHTSPSRSNTSSKSSPSSSPHIPSHLHYNHVERAKPWEIHFSQIPEESVYGPGPPRNDKPLELSPIQELGTLSQLTAEGATPSPHRNGWGTHQQQQQQQPVLPWKLAAALTPLAARSRAEQDTHRSPTTGRLSPEIGTGAGASLEALAAAAPAAALDMGWDKPAPSSASGSISRAAAGLTSGPCAPVLIKGVGRKALVDTTTGAAAGDGTAGRVGASTLLSSSADSHQSKLHAHRPHTLEPALSLSAWQDVLDRSVENATAAVLPRNVASEIAAAAGGPANHGAAGLAEAAAADKSSPVRCRTASAHRLGAEQYSNGGGIAAPGGSGVAGKGHSSPLKAASPSPSAAAAAGVANSPFVARRHTTEPKSNRDVAALLEQLSNSRLLRRLSTQGYATAAAPLPAAAAGGVMWSGGKTDGEHEDGFDCGRSGEVGTGAEEGREDMSIGTGGLFVGADFDKLLSALKRVTTDREAEEFQQQNQDKQQALEGSAEWQQQEQWQQQRQQEQQHWGGEQAVQQWRQGGPGAATGAGMGVELEGLSSELRTLLQQLAEDGRIDQRSPQDDAKRPSGPSAQAKSPTQLVSLEIRNLIPFFYRDAAGSQSPWQQSRSTCHLEMDQALAAKYDTYIEDTRVGCRIDNDDQILCLS